MSILLSHNTGRDTIESEIHCWSGGAVFVYRGRTAASHYLPYIFIYIYSMALYSESLSSSRHVGFLFTHMLSSLFYIPALSLSLSLCLAACLSLPVFLTVFQHTLRCCHIPSPSALSFHQQAALFWSLESGRTSLNTEGDKDISCCYCLYLNEQLETVLFFFCSHFKQQKPIEGSICSEVNALIKKAAIH